MAKCIKAYLKQLEVAAKRNYLINPTLIWNPDCWDSLPRLLRAYVSNQARPYRASRLAAPDLVPGYAFKSLEMFFACSPNLSHSVFTFQSQPVSPNVNVRGLSRDSSTPTSFIFYRMQEIAIIFWITMRDHGCHSEKAEI